LQGEERGEGDERREETSRRIVLIMKNPASEFQSGLLHETTCPPKPELFPASFRPFNFLLFPSSPTRPGVHRWVIS
jgi:hypothetical protein